VSTASFQSVVYASTIGGRERWREKLEQGMFGAVAATLCLLLFAGLAIFHSSISCGADVFAPTTHFGTVFFASDALDFKVTPHGEFVANGIWIPTPNLRGFVREVLAEEPDRIITLEADRTLPFREVKSVLQLFEGLGARKIYLVTNEDSSPLLKLFSEPWSTNHEGN